MRIISGEWPGGLHFKMSFETGELGLKGDPLIFRFSN